MCALTLWPGLSPSCWAASITQKTAGSGTVAVGVAQDTFLTRLDGGGVPGPRCSVGEPPTGKSIKMVFIISG